MNRLIKFRVLDTLNNKIYTTEQELRDFAKLENEDYLRIKWGDFSNLRLLQWTGLHDKNGKEIYEGDIAVSKHTPDIKSEVKFGLYSPNYDNELVMSMGFHMDRLNPDGTIRYSCGVGKDINGDENYLEIIGNVYENTDLLK